MHDGVAHRLIIFHQQNGLVTGVVMRQVTQGPARAGFPDGWRRRLLRGAGQQLLGQFRRVLAGTLDFLHVAAVRVALGHHAQQQLAEAGDDREGVIQTMRHLRDRDGVGFRRACRRQPRPGRV